MKPSPVASAHICSACGLDWARHSDKDGKMLSQIKPTLEKCVELLKADLAKARSKSQWESTSALKVVGGQR